MVLGTLIIVIAIAAESSPKLMDLFVKDWLSLTYVWFLILASLHAVVIMFYVGPLGRVSSVVLNIYVFLFLGSIFTLPYIFYLQSTLHLCYTTLCLDWQSNGNLSPLANSCSF